MAKKIILTVLLILLCLNPAVAGENNGQVPVLIQVSSNLSDGRLSSDEIMHIAEGEGFKAVVFTDREIMRWEYGLWPLRNLLKKKVEQNSIFKYGISKYFEYMRELKKRFPDMAIILGAETTPYYYWMGNPFKGGLKLFNAHKHLLVF
ncbi:MAG: hypothetical protein HY810_03580 [Candidatus Omnitrophica bacterium]|nr:hypothetical protein [Candidatus Omnitrophota bacterium]